jgi:transcriptional regulator GlxA family with amidase domain
MMRTLSDMHRVALAVTDGTPLFELGPPCEVFGIDRSDLGVPWYDFALHGPPGARIGGLFRADAVRDLETISTADTVIIPACRSVDEPPPADLVDAVRSAYDAGARIASLCTGAFVLAAAGLLDGRRAATHWAHADELAEWYPSVKVDADVLYVDEGQVLTSAGKAAAMDLCLHLVRTDHGAAIANALARRLVVPPHRAGGQAQFVAAPVPDGRDHPLAELTSWALVRLDQPLTVGDLARQVNVGPRQLTRLFIAATGTTPLQWLLMQRVYRAQELLETTDDAIERIAAACGMGTATTLRRHFSKTVGVPPDSYRRTFRAGRVSV